MNAKQILERVSHATYLLGYLGLTPRPGSDILKVVEEFSQELRIYATLRVQEDRPVDTVNYDLFCNLYKAVTSGTETDMAIVRTFLFGAHFRDGPLPKEYLLSVVNALMVHAQDIDTILRTWTDGIISGELTPMGLTALDIATILTLLIDPDIDPASNIRVPMGRYHIWVNLTDDQRVRASMVLGSHSDKSSRIVLLHELDRLLNNPGVPTHHTITDQHLADIRVHELAPDNNPQSGWVGATGFGSPYQRNFQQPRRPQFQPPGFGNTTYLDNTAYNPVDQHEIDRQVHHVVCSVTEPSMGAKIIRPEVISAIRELYITLHRAEIDLELTLTPPSK